MKKPIDISQGSDICSVCDKVFEAGTLKAVSEIEFDLICPKCAKKTARNLWKNDKVQFARLIAEAEAAGAFTPKVLKDMADSMDLYRDEVRTVIGRAQDYFDEVKAKLCQPKR